MADNVNLVTWTGQNVTPLDDAVIYNAAINASGLFYGGNITIKNANTLHVSAGHGVIAGRKFTLYDGDIILTLSPHGTLHGRVYLHLDLSNAAEPIQILTETGSSVSPPQQDENVNIINGVYEFDMAYFNISESTISDLRDVSPGIQRGKGGTSTATKEDILRLSRVTFDDKYLLGNQYTAEQKEMIAAGELDQFPNGAYWNVDGIYVRVWDNTNWYKWRGDTAFTADHLVIAADENILKADGSTTRYMQDTNVTTGGYSGTKYRSQYRAQAKKFYTDFFGTANIASYRGLITTAVNTTTGRASSWAWSDCDVELPTEDMVFGTSRWGDGAGNGYGSGSFHGQMQLFRLAPEYIVAKTAAGARENYWEQNVVSAASFSLVNSDGVAGGSGASHPSVGCRPFALLI